MNVHSGWPLVVLGELTTSVRSWNPKRSPNAVFGYIDLSSVDQLAKAIVTTTQQSGASAPSRARQLVKVGDVLVSTVRPNLNGVAPVTERYDGATASTGFCVLRPVTSKLDSAYLMHWVRSPQFVDQMVRQATGASYPAITDRIVKASPIPLPALEEQRRIAAILDKADALRAKRKRALALLDTLTQSIFLEMFGDFDDNHRDLRIVELGELVAEGPTNGLYKPSSAYGDGAPILRINNFYGGEVVDLSALRRLRVTPDEIKQYELRCNDLVVNRVNSREYVGKSALVPKLTEPTVYESNMMRLRVRSDIIRPEVCIQALQTHSIWRQVQAKTKDAINQSSINQKDVRSLLLPLPKLDEQEVFCSARHSALNQKNRMARGAHSAEALFASLQSRAFTGQL